MDSVCAAFPGPGPLRLQLLMPFGPDDGPFTLYDEPHDESYVADLSWRDALMTIREMVDQPRVHRVRVETRTGQAVAYYAREYDGSLEAP